MQFAKWTCFFYKNWLIWLIITDNASKPALSVIEPKPCTDITSKSEI